MFEGPSLIAKRFFQGMIIGALHLVIGIIKVRNWFQQTFGDSQLLRGMNAQKIAVYAGMLAVYGLAAGLAIAAAAATVLAAGLGLIVGAITAVVGLFGMAVVQTFKLGSALIGFFRDVITAPRKLLDGKSWFEAGKALVMGLVEGIKSGVGWVTGAIGNMAKSAIGAFREKFQIHSPSLLMRKDARQLPRGAALGIDDDAPKVDAAISKMGSGATAPRGAAGRAAAAQPLIGSLTLNISAPSGQVQDIKAACLEAVQQAFQTVRTQLAAAPAV